MFVARAASLPPKGYKHAAPNGANWRLTLQTTSEFQRIAL